jgi:hypothetical protein
MPATREEAKTIYNAIKKNGSYYNRLNEDGKKSYWQYVHDNGLVPEDKLNDSGKAEYNRYVNRANPLYGQSTGHIEQKLYNPSEEEQQANPNARSFYYNNLEGEKGLDYYERLQMDPNRDSMTQKPQPTSADKRRLLNESRLEELTPKSTPQTGIGKAGLAKVPTTQNKTMIPVGKAGIIKTQARDFNGIDAALLGALDSTTLGAMNIRDDAAIKDNKGAFTAGQIAGYIAPGAALANTAGKGLAKLGAGKLVQNLGGSAIAGATIDTGQGLVAGDTGKELAKRVGRGALIGLAADGALMGLGKIGQGIMKKLADKQTLSAAEKAVVDKLPDEAKKEIILYVDTYGNVRKTPETDLLLEAPARKVDVPKVKNITNTISPSDTKILDEKGNPLTVYHGTPTNFDKFDKSFIGSRTDEGAHGKGFYFTKNKNIALPYTRTKYDIREITDTNKVISANIKIKKPLRLGNDEKIPDNVISDIKKIYNERIEAYNKTLPEEDSIFGTDRESLLNNELDNKPLGEILRVINNQKDIFPEALKRNGYDGVIVDNGREYVVFEPEQINILKDKPNIKTVGGQTLKPNKPILSTLDARLNKPYIANDNRMTDDAITASKKKLGLSTDILPPGITKINKAVVTPPLAPKAVMEPPVKPQNIDTARAKINYTPAKKGKFQNLWLKTRSQLVDKYAPLEDLEKNVRGKLASAESSPYKQARLYEGTPEKANLIIQNELKPIIQVIEGKGYDYKDLGLYAEAMHAKDVNTKGLVSGFTDAEIDDVIKKLGTPDMEAARKKLIEYNDNRLQTLLKNPITGEDGSIITLDSYNKLKTAWPNYMPLNRFFDDDKIDFVNGLSKSFANVGTPIDTLKGSKRDIIDPIESMVRNTFRTESAAGRNKVGLQMSQLAKEDTAQKFIRKIADDEITDRKNVISVIENGKKVKYEVEPEVYRTMKNMDEKVNSVLIKVLQAPASVLRAGATLTPEFSVRNPIRDIFNAYIVSKSGFNPFTDFASGLASYIKKGESYQDFLKNNGGYGNIISMDRKIHRQALESMLKKSPGEKFVNIINPKSWVGLMRTISDATESATKIGEFRAAIRKGVNPQEAAYRARDLLDFARAGTSVKELNKVTAFLNANVQGKSKFIRAIKEDPKGVTTRLFYTMAAPSLGAYALNYYYANDKQKATIKDAPDWLRDSFWLTAIPGTDMVARVPKPFDASAVSNTIERMLDYTAGKDPDAFDGFIKTTIKEQSIPVMLTGLAPIIEGMTNYSFFRGAPIIPLREQMLQPKDQYDIYTSEVSKTIAAAVRAIAGDETNFGSPRIMENSIRGLTAGLGGYALDTVDAIAGKEKPAKNISQLPVIKAFAVNEYSSGKSMNFVYDEKDRLTKEKNSLRLGKLQFTKQKQLKYLETVISQIGDISTEIRKIQNSNNLTSTEKRDKINVLSEKRNNIARDAQSQYKTRKW